jgi:tetratricopeptide (TPR) repeat protein
VTLFLTLHAGCSGPPVFAPPAVEEALAQADWPQVAQLLADVNEQTPDAVLRLIRGHACLALNDNNRALGLFLGVRDRRDLSRCRAWANRYADDRSGSATAQYLRGDVLSRQGRQDAALPCLDRALELDPAHLLARHARAVLHAALGDFAAASDDFSTAKAGQPRLAELYVSYATYLVQKRADAGKALEGYDKALQISPDYVLALNGRGAMLQQLGRLPEASETLAKARELSVGGLAAMADVVDMNLVALSGKVNKDLETRLAAVAGWQPGMSVDEKLRLFDSYDDLTKQNVLNDVANAAAFNDRRLGDWTRPSSITAGIECGIEESLVGPTVFGKGHLDATWDNQATQHNWNVQNDFLEAAAARGYHPEIDATSPWNNVKSFFGNQFGPSHDFSHPGGVSTGEIAAGLDRGDWNVFMTYGLLYKVQAGV